MGDASMSVEQGIIVDQQSKEQVTSDKPKQEEITPLSKHIDLDAFYQTEVDRYKKEQDITGKKAWKLLEKTAKDKASSGDYRQQETGTAQSPDPKIDTLARVLNMQAEASEIDQLQTIINNPDYLEFVAYLAENKISMRGDRVPILDNIVALDKAGVLKPVVNLYRLGVLLHIPHYGGEEVRDWFSGMYADSYGGPQKLQQVATRHMQDLLHSSSELIQEFLQNPQKKEFVSMLASLRGNPITTFDLHELEKKFGKDLSRKREAIYALRFRQGDREKHPDAIDIKLDDLNSISDSQPIMEALTNTDFPIFLQTLQEKTGYIADFRNPYFYRAGGGNILEELAHIFNDPALRRGLFQESTLKFIKEFYPNGNLYLPLIDHYIELGNNPNTLQAIHVLRDLGGGFSLKNLDSIANDPDTLSKLTSTEFKSVLKRLSSYNCKFDPDYIQELVLLLESPDKEHIFQALDILKEKFQFSYNHRLLPYYIRLAQIPDVENKLREAGTSIAPEDLLQGWNFKLFVISGTNAKLYNHAKALLSDDYFKNIRDAQNRLDQFIDTIDYGNIPDVVTAKVFALSQKATELDRLALKLGINEEIAKAANRKDWHASLLQATNFQEANEALTRMTTDLAIPAIYSGLQGEELSTKQNELIELAGKDKEFDDILEINCRSVGVYGQRYPSKGQEFDVLMGAIRQSLELNLERNPKAYLEKRAELSEHQFNRIFEGVSQDVRDRVMKTWLDLSPTRRLRVSGDIIASEEATLSRLNRIRDIVYTDLSVHLQELFATKVRELETAYAQGETNGPGVEQLTIYKQYLMTPEGMIRQDIPMMYRSIETFIRDAQAKLKNPETPKEEKGRLGKNLGAYQAISGSLKALYRLGTISEKRYKARRDYLNEIEKHIGGFSGALKRLKILDPDRRSQSVNTRALEEEVLLDFGKLKGTMVEENITGQTVFDTQSTVDFRNLARAPEITQSCQRLTEVTGYNHAAYSRLLDGSNEMIDIYEMRNGERNRLARSFIELSRVKLTGEKQPRLVVLIDREYVNPQYQNFGYQFSSEMMLHMLDRISPAPELSLIFDSNRFTASPEVQEMLQARGYRLREISGEYFVNESNVKLAKYYDSLGGVNNVAQPSYEQFSNFYIVEKL